MSTSVVRVYVAASLSDLTIERADLEGFLVKAVCQYGIDRAGVRIEVKYPMCTTIMQVFVLSMREVSETARHRRTVQTEVRFYAHPMDSRQTVAGITIADAVNVAPDFFVQQELQYDVLYAVVDTGTTESPNTTTVNPDLNSGASDTADDTSNSDLVLIIVGAIVFVLIIVIIVFMARVMRSGDDREIIQAPMRKGSEFIMNTNRLHDANANRSDAMSVRSATPQMRTDEWDIVQGILNTAHERAQQQNTSPPAAPASLPSVIDIAGTLGEAERGPVFSDSTRAMLLADHDVGGRAGWTDSPPPGGTDKASYFDIRSQATNMTRFEAPSDDELENLYSGLGPNPALLDEKPRSITAWADGPSGRGPARDVNTSWNRSPSAPRTSTSPMSTSPMSTGGLPGALGDADDEATAPNSPAGQQLQSLMQMRQLCSDELLRSNKRIEQLKHTQQEVEKKLMLSGRGSPAFGLLGTGTDYIDIVDPGPTAEPKEQRSVIPPWQQDPPWSQLERPTRPMSVPPTMLGGESSAKKQKKQKAPKRAKTPNPKSSKKLATPPSQHYHPRSASAVSPEFYTLGM